jgi:hypothetical protein
MNTPRIHIETFPAGSSEPTQYIFLAVVYSSKVVEFRLPIPTPNPNADAGPIAVDVVRKQVRGLVKALSAALADPNGVVNHSHQKFVKGE